MATQGFLATLELDGNDISLVVTDYSLDRTKTILDKSVQDRSGYSASIPGKQSGTLSLDARLDTVNLSLLEASWAKAATVPFVLEVTEGNATDASWAGELTMGDISVGGSFGDQWAVSLSGDTSGPVTFTPVAP